MYVAGRGEGSEVHVIPGILYLVDFGVHPSAPLCFWGPLFPG